MLIVSSTLTNHPSHGPKLGHKPVPLLEIKMRPSGYDPIEPRYSNRSVGQISLMRAPNFFFVFF